MFNLEEVGRYVAQYRPDGLIIDTNILLLFLVGSYSKEFIEKCVLFTDNNKRYCIDDFELLKKIFAYFQKLVVTPQVVAELSNLSITGGDIKSKETFHAYINAVIDFLKSAEERHQKTDSIWGMELKTIGRFGFTDMTMFELSKQTKMPILTDELALFQYSWEKVPVIKFEYIKNAQLQSFLG